MLNDNNDDEASFCVDSSSDDESSVKKPKKVEPKKKAAPKKNKKKGADVSETDTRKGPGRKKFAIAPNYSEDEDYLIAVAFVSVTVDPIRGVGQKSENFWTRVHEKFCLLQQSELGSDS